jgi:probable selenium-dependent hydroxylase accessory protein YqeC
MFCLANQLASMGKKVISTTTTRIGLPSSEDTPCLIMEPDEECLFQKFMHVLPMYNHVTIGHSNDGGGKIKGLATETVDRIYRLNLVDYIINEADGAGGCPIKAPRQGEPVIPATTTLVLMLVGMDVFGKPLSTDNAFRIELITHLTGLEKTGLVTEEVLATLLTHPRGIGQNSQVGMRIVPFLNKSDIVLPTDVYSVAAAILARRHSQIHTVVSGALKYPQSIYRIFTVD